MAGYVMLLTEAKTPAAHIILKTGAKLYLRIMGYLMSV
jgi:hypothetical protein